MYETDCTIISIHALLAESDCAFSEHGCDFWRFLSTLSLRRATAVPTLQPWHAANFYPRSPCGERQQAQGLKIPTHSISIHALLAESDKPRILLSLTFHHFYPRSPCGERLHHRTRRQSPSHFYPRSPCGERLLDAVQIVIIVIFLSTLSLRRATHALP